MGDKTSDMSEMKALEALFAEARQDTSGPSSDLLARVLADADTQQAAHLAARAAPFVPPQPGKKLWTQIFVALGGAPGFAGLAATAVVGVWIGVNPPDAMSQSVDGLLTDLAFEATETDLSFSFDGAFDFAMGEG